MRHREKGRRLPDIDVLARGFLRRGLSEHPDAAKHVANIGDIENMSAWELLNLAKTMGVDPAAMIRSVEQEDDKRWTYSHHNPGFTGELEVDLVLELLGRKATRKAMSHPESSKKNAVKATRKLSLKAKSTLNCCATLSAHATRSGPLRSGDYACALVLCTTATPSNWTTPFAGIQENPRR